MSITRFLLALFTVSGIIFPNISVAGIDVSKLNTQEATVLLQEKFSVPTQITLIHMGQAYPIETKNFDLTYDYLKSAQRAYELVRTGNVFYDLKLKAHTLFNPKDLGLIASYDNNKLESLISVISAQVSIDPIYPQVSIKDGQVEVVQGVKGFILDNDALISDLSQNLAYAQNSEVEIKIKEVDPTLTQIEIENLRVKASQLIGKKLEIKNGHEVFTKTDIDLIKLVDTSERFNQAEMKKLVNELALKINREPQNAKFEFSNNKVSVFQPALDGIQVDKEKLTNLIIESIENQTYTVAAPVVKTAPVITTDKVNNLGIKELIGRGNSTYFHSIPNRVHNVALAASRINGTLVSPGETFSFNNTIGDISQSTGYKTAYVILSGKTVLGDGGGVCQVSSTLFRAVLNAGLQIDARTAHAYRVGYYEQGSSPGIDATVYSPSPDFKFTNDTANHVLVTAKADSKNYSLVFELYGTKDGRVSEVSKPVITSQTTPGPDVYQDDPTLPVGTVKQVEYRAYGAKVYFNYLVTRNGEELHKKTFTSNYRPWAAVYLKGVGPAI